jgi:hypothetical protein
VYARVGERLRLCWVFQKKNKKEEGQSTWRGDHTCSARRPCTGFLLKKLRLFLFIEMLEKIIGIGIFNDTSMEKV